MKTERQRDRGERQRERTWKRNMNCSTLPDLELDDPDTTWKEQT